MNDINWAAEMRRSAKELRKRGFHREADGNAQVAAHIECLEAQVAAFQAERRHPGSARSIAIAAAVQAERERCAKIAELHGKNSIARQLLTTAIATAIREGGTIDASVSQGQKHREAQRRK